MMDQTTFGQHRRIRTADEWVSRELALHEDHYTKISGMNFSFVTFNVAEKKPADMSWLLKNMDGSPDDPAGIVVGLQEVDMSASALMKEETEAAFPWVTAMREAIGADHEKLTPQSTKLYYPLATKQLVGLLICVFVKKSLLSSMQDLAIGQIATGALGAVGNKGGVGVRFKLNLTTICVINCHLAAHQNHVDKRNQDIDQIIRDLSFQLPPSQRNPAGVIVYPRDHDVIAVVGDLNYRVDIVYEQAVQMAKSGNISGLLEADQLRREMLDPHSPWVGFEDCVPTWPPTYRFDKGTCEYDTSEKKRIPSFTDRILFWAKDRRHKKFEIIEKHSLNEVLVSDHKPVRVSAMIPVRTLEKDLQMQTRQKLQQTVAELGLDRVMTARTTIDPVSLDFGETSYHVETKRTVTISNIGDCVAEVNVMRRGDGDPTEGSWIRAEPLWLLLFPGEKQQIELTCRTDKVSSAWLAGCTPFESHQLKRADGKFELTSFLSLAVSNGPLHLLECHTVMQPSCYGASLDNLIRIGNLPIHHAYVADTAPPAIAENHPQLPKELWYLVDFLFHNGATTSNLFFENGKESEMAAVRMHLDSQIGPLPADIASAHSVAHCLVTFLRDLQNTVIPESQYFSALAAGRQGSKAPHNLVSQLPVLHCNVFLYTMSFIRFLLRPSYASKNELTEDIVCNLFSNIFFPDHNALASKNAFGGETGFASATEFGFRGSGPSYVDPYSPAVGSQGGPRRGAQDLRAELASRRTDAVNFLRAFLQD